MFGRGGFYPYYGSMNNFRAYNSFNPGFATFNQGFGRRGLGSLFGLGRSGRSFNLANLLSGAQKTLNVVNQAIPIIRQAGPMFNNMKTMFKLANAFKEVDDTPSKKNTSSKNAIAENSETRENTSVNQSIVTEEKEINTPNFFI